MKDFVDGNAFNNEQGNRARKLFAAVVLAALDDAIADIRNMATDLSRLHVGPALAMGAKCSPAPALIPTNVWSLASWISSEKASAPPWL